MLIVVRSMETWVNNVRFQCSVNTARVLGPCLPVPVNTARDSANTGSVYCTERYSWFPPSRNVGNVCNVRNLVNVGRWRNGHTLRTLRENVETK